MTGDDTAPCVARSSEAYAYTFLCINSSRQELNWPHWPNSQNSKCTCSISHNAPVMRPFLFWMGHYRIWNRCILRFVILINQLFEAEWHTYASRIEAIIGSDNGLSPDRRHYPNYCWHSVSRTLWKNFQRNINWNFNSLIQERCLSKRSSAKWRPFRLGLHMLTHFLYSAAPLIIRILSSVNMTSA